MARRKIAAAAALAGLLAVGLLGFAPSAQAAGNRPGQPCKAAKTKVHWHNVDLTCMKRNGRLVWTMPKKAVNASMPADDPVEMISKQSQIPQVLENLGFDLQPYDPATGRAGAMQIAGVTPPVFPAEPDQTAAYRYTINPYGTQWPDGQEPQLSFVLPLGTPVISPVTGVVCELITLYSNDSSIRIAPKGTPCIKGRATILVETEHVINPVVTVGQEITAGQPIAQVSNYGRWWAEKGYGVVELGVAINRTDNQGMAWHSCPTLSLNPARASAVTSALASAMTAWNAQLGAPLLYDVAAQNPTGCLTQGWVGDSNVGRK